MRVDNPEAPLFGRPCLEIKLKRLNAQKSKTFLERGFEEEGLKVPSEVIKEAVKRFDGNIGWLTYFGYSYTRGNETIDRIFEKALKLSVNEVKHALNVYGLGRRRYVEVLKIVASGTSFNWSEIKRGIEAKLGKIPNNTLSNIIHNLVNQGFLEKTGGEYTIPDPILRNGIIKYL